MPKLVLERPAVIEERIAAETNLPVEEVSRLVAACRDAVDELIADDWSIAAYPLLFATTSDFVFYGLLSKLKTCTDNEAQSCLAWEAEALAPWLGVTVEELTLTRLPIMTPSSVPFVID